MDQVPSEPGIYIVARSRSDLPNFLDASVGGHFKSKDPTVTQAVLARNWVEGTCVLYVGKANVLRRRLNEFVRFGAGSPIGHWGGRLLWQLEDSQDLLVAWLPTPGEDPESVERATLNEFVQLYDGRLPFANLLARQIP